MAFFYWGWKISVMLACAACLALLLSRGWPPMQWQADAYWVCVCSAFVSVICGIPLTINHYKR